MSGRSGKSYPDHRRFLYNIKTKNSLSKAEFSRLASTGVELKERSKEIIAIVEKNKRNISELYFFITTLLDRTWSMQNSKEDIQLSNMFLVFCKRLIDFGDRKIEWKFKNIHIKDGMMTNVGDEDALAQCILELCLWKSELNLAMNNKEESNHVIKDLLQEPDKHLENKQTTSRNEDLDLSVAKKKFNQYYNQKEAFMQAGGNVDETTNPLFKMYTLHEDEERFGGKIIKTNPLSIGQHEPQDVASSCRDPKKYIQKALREDEQYTDKQIDDALQICNQHPNSALERLRQEEKILRCKINISFGHKQNIQQILITGNRNPAKIFEKLSTEAFNASECRGSGSSVDVFQIFNNSMWNDERKLRVIQCELFDNDQHASERAHFLYELFRRYKSDDKAKDKENREFWNFFDSYSSTELTTTVKALTELNFDTFIRHPSLKGECNVCYEKFFKPQVIQYNCEDKCVTCCGCVMENIANHMDKTHRNLQCMMHRDGKRDDQFEIETFAKLQNYCHTHGDELKELFQRFDRCVNSVALEKMDDFTRCAHPPCTGGHVRSGNKNKPMKCALCRKKTCHDCKLPWEKAHKGITCQAYEFWVRRNKPELVIAEGVLNFVICPKCNAQYEMVRGGCIHFTCQECNFDFCGFCRQAFHSPQKNPCKSCGTESTKGMHAHHPRHCPYYLRDYDVDLLWKLVQEHDQNMDILVPKNDSANKKCDIEYVNDNQDRLLCELNPADKCQGYCKRHFIELLTGAIYSTGEIDPIILMNKDQLRVLADRENVDFKELTNLSLDEIRRAMRDARPLVEDN